MEPFDSSRLGSGPYNQHLEWIRAISIFIYSSRQLFEALNSAVPVALHVIENSLRWFHVLLNALKKSAFRKWLLEYTRHNRVLKMAIVLASMGIASLLVKTFVTLSQRLTSMHSIVKYVKPF